LKNVIANRIAILMQAMLFLEILAGIRINISILHTYLFRKMVNSAELIVETYH